MSSTQPNSIALSKGLYALVDAEDLDLVSSFRWHAKHSKGNWYASTRIDGDTVFMHNLILGWRKGFEVDHVDRNGLNNLKSNLRHSTLSQNRANVSLRKDNNTGFKGVSFNKAAKKWIAYINKDKKRKHLGFYITAKEAARAYNIAAFELFGEFAWLNPIR